MNLNKMKMSLEELRAVRILVKTCFAQFSAMTVDSGYDEDVIEGLALQRELIDHKLMVLWSAYKSLIPEVANEYEPIEGDSPRCYVACPMTKNPTSRCI